MTLLVLYEIVTHLELESMVPHEHLKNVHFPKIQFIPTLIRWIISPRYCRSVHKNCCFTLHKACPVLMLILDILSAHFLLFDFIV